MCDCLNQLEKQHTRIVHRILDYNYPLLLLFYVSFPYDGQVEDTTLHMDLVCYADHFVVEVSYCNSKKFVNALLNVTSLN